VLDLRVHELDRPYDEAAIAYREAQLSGRAKRLAHGLSNCAAPTEGFALQAANRNIEQG